jgi:hypothetical protein
VAFLYAKDQQAEKEIRKTTSRDSPMSMVLCLANTLSGCSQSSIGWSTRSPMKEPEKYPVSWEETEAPIEGTSIWTNQYPHGRSFRLRSELCLCNSFHGYFVPPSKFYVEFLDPLRLELYKDIRMYQFTFFYMLTTSWASTICWNCSFFPPTGVLTPLSKIKSP